MQRLPRKSIWTQHPVSMVQSYRRHNKSFCKHKACSRAGFRHTDVRMENVCSPWSRGNTLTALIKPWLLSDFYTPSQITTTTKQKSTCDFTLLYTCLQPTGTPPPTIFRFTEPNRTEEMKYHKLLIERQHKICTDNPKSSVFSKASTGLGLAPAYLASVTLYMAACFTLITHNPLLPTIQFTLRGGGGGGGSGLWLKAWN